MKICGMTDSGKVRKQNQDAFYHWTDGNQGCVLVCDGMGGALSGNVASAMAAQRFAETVSAGEGTPEERLLRAEEKANQTVYTRSRQDYTCWGMGTTLVAALAKETEAHIINVGDSRCYLLSGGTIRQVTRDHSLVAELVAAGRLTPEEARTHPNRNIITRALGTESSVEADLFHETLAPGDRLLLCSDGLSNEVQDAELLALAGEGEPASCCEALLELALERGAPDNVTVVLLMAEGTETPALPRQA